MKRKRRRSRLKQSSKPSITIYGGEGCLDGFFTDSNKEDLSLGKRLTMFKLTLWVSVSLGVD